MNENLPVNKRPDYLEHVKKLEELSNYLVGQMGFRVILNQWCSYEFTTVFKNENTEIRIVFETSIPSSIKLVNTDLPYDESRGLTNVEYIAEFNQTTIEVIKNRLKDKEEKNNALQQHLKLMRPFRLRQTLTRLTMSISVL